MESVDWEGGWFGGNGGNGFDILVKRTEKIEEHAGIKVMEKDEMKKRVPQFT